jgi:hypothetical protein
MKRIALAAMAVSLFALTAIAQTKPSATPPANTGPGNSAVNAPNEPAKAGAPVAVANSFTESQAKSRIEDKGFSTVTNLKKDDTGVWRATATKDGKQHNVSVDFQGNVVAQ